MNSQELMQKLKEGFCTIINNNGLNTEEITITAKSLSPEEAIGQTQRKDYPILTGKEVMLQAEYKGAFGQAFTDAPSAFKGTLGDIIELNLSEDKHNLGLFIAAMNAVMAKLGICCNTVHCRTEEPEECAEKLSNLILEQYEGKKIALVGYQPSMIEALSVKCDLRVLDLNPANVGHTRYGIMIEDGEKDYKAVVLDWADVVFCTGSSLCNGTICNYLDTGKETVFFGITAAGAAKILGLNRFCPCSK